MAHPYVVVRHGEAEKRQSGKVAKWQSGETAKRQSGEEARRQGSVTRVPFVDTLCESRFTTHPSLCTLGSALERILYLQRIVLSTTPCGASFERQPLNLWSHLRLAKMQKSTVCHFAVTQFSAMQMKKLVYAQRRANALNVRSL
ncbi:hypothetical protein POVWA2_025770 [Plasmodium ovale wallikeri]|uniref:Phosphoglycerate mutase n=1 Tax=Plasmodium ovale wallikeri TaxID=864142 RepID=A0A1A8YUN4_PLAOA|nr:hypothetical protein POVWA1_025940 [Plasmodium ovale wallikeri]SBT35595.1 hypothetical protein POVWA2_025770 [Plasmodium ovale wallikeri]